MGGPLYELGDVVGVDLGFVFLTAFIIVILYWLCCTSESKSGTKQSLYPDLSKEFGQNKTNSLLNLYNANSINAIRDRFDSLEAVSDAIRRAGLESSNLIFGVDYTISNMSQGIETFGGQSLHCMSGAFNPYQQVISILGETLEPFDDDGIIPAFGFGDVSTKDKRVFPFRQEGYCQGFHDVLAAYNQITPNVKMSGPTNFAPLIRQAISIVQQTRAYHILIIVADGQVTQERDTRAAIVEASQHPLSIIMIGVGDGPWEQMVDFDDRLPQRKFDNFQFVDFAKVTKDSRNPSASFALHALMEIPDQFKLIKKLGLLDM